MAWRSGCQAREVCDIRQTINLPLFWRETPTRFRLRIAHVMEASA